MSIHLIRQVVVGIALGHVQAVRLCNVVGVFFRPEVFRYRDVGGNIVDLTKTNLDVADGPARQSYPRSFFLRKHPAATTEFPVLSLIFLPPLPPPLPPRMSSPLPHAATAAITSTTAATAAAGVHLNLSKT